MSRIVLAALAALAVLAPLAMLPSLAMAGRPSDGLPVMAAGREQEALGLVAPFKMGDAVAPGWVFDGAQISEVAIRYVLHDASGGSATLRLELPLRAPSTDKSASFALHRDLALGKGDAKAAATALDAMAAAVRKNDPGGFWPATAPSDPTEDQWSKARTDHFVEGTEDPAEDPAKRRRTQALTALLALALLPLLARMARAISRR